MAAWNGYHLLFEMEIIESCKAASQVHYRAHHYKKVEETPVCAHWLY